MKQKLLFIISCLFAVTANAQVTISAQLPPAGMIQKEQLWNITLVNNKEDVVDVVVRMNVQDATTGEMVMTANTGNVLLNKGVKILNSSEVQPILYNFNRDNFSKSFLPMGAYVACYQVYKLDEKGEQLLGDECIKFNIDPLSPPLLMSPADKTEVATPYPQFSWVPPSPSDMFTNLNYEITVVEVLEGQSAVDAIQQNTPVYSKANISQTFESYATSITALQPDKTYAWQVIATNENNYAAKTEVWSFKVQPVNQELNPSESYAIAKPYYSSKKYYFRKSLLISLTNPYASKKLSYAIIDVVTKKAINKHLPNITINTGLNNITIDSKSLKGLRKNRVYTLEIYNIDNVTYYVNFVLTK